MIRRANPFAWRGASLLAMLFVFNGFIPQSMASINDYFTRIKSNPNALYAFFKEMPKGGELHYHLAGGAYPETMLALASQKDYCLNIESKKMSQLTGNCQGVLSASLLFQPDLYQQVIRAWSMKGFIPGQESGHDHFFATFFKFIPIEADFRPQLLAEIMQRASNQHELYLEIMVIPDNANSTTFAQLVRPSSDFLAKKRTLLANALFQQNIQHTIEESKRILQAARLALGCEKFPQQRVCSLAVKFQYFVLREQPIDQVFAQALNGFAAAAASNDIVGVNLVQPEDGIISLRDYQKQMRIFEFLHSAYPTVHIALHAGELGPKDVPPKELRFHINDAIHVGQAERIGHGVAIAYEDNAEALLRDMAHIPIPVEINLTSNEAILQVTGQQHPLNYYLSHDVPVVLSTDDEGVLRTDLTREYVKAVTEHGLDYQTLKTITRNALTYSFLPGKSLWTDPKKAVAVPECQDRNSPSCQQFINKNEKAHQQWQLEKNLSEFEQRF